jgi:hypothetical protein
MDQKQMVSIVEHYSRESLALYGDIKVISVPDFQTIFIESIGGYDDAGRSILLTEYRVDGKVFWAGYSTRTQTVYVSRG